VASRKLCVRCMRSISTSEAKLRGWSTMPNGTVPVCASEHRSAKAQQTSWSQPAHEQIPADAMVARWRRSAAPSSLRSLHRHTRRWVWGIDLTGSPIQTRPLPKRHDPPMSGQFRLQARNPSGAENHGTLGWRHVARSFECGRLGGERGLAGGAQCHRRDAVGS
jgi:hypothetical protein